MGFVDWVVLGTMVVSVLFALYRGLLRELLGISSWILAGLTAIYSYQPATGLLIDRVENVKLWALTVSVVLALIVLIIMTIINARITKSLRKSSLSGLDRLLGFVFGVARALLFIILVWMIAEQMVWTPEHVQQMHQKNLSVPYIQELAEQGRQILPPAIQQEMQRPTLPIRKPMVEYPNKDREKLNQMIEDIIEIEE